MPVLPRRGIGIVGEELSRAADRPSLLVVRGAPVDRGHATLIQENGDAVGGTSGGARSGYRNLGAGTSPRDQASSDAFDIREWRATKELPERIDNPDVIAGLVALLRRDLVQRASGVRSLRRPDQTARRSADQMAPPDAGSA